MWYDKQVAEINERRRHIEAIRQRVDDADLTWLMSEYDKLEAFCNATCEAFENTCLDCIDAVERQQAQILRTQ